MSLLSAVYYVRVMEALRVFMTIEEFQACTSYDDCRALALISRRLHSEGGWYWLPRYQYDVNLFRWHMLERAIELAIEAEEGLSFNSAYRCFSCGINEADELLGYDECWECFTEH